MSRLLNLSRFILMFTLLALFAVSGITVSPVSAASIVVNSNGDTLIDDGLCTLREAIIAANTDAPYFGCPGGSGEDTIVLPEGIYTLESQLPNIMSQITISGVSAESTIIQASVCSPVTAITPGECPPADYRILRVDPLGDLVLDRLMLRHGNVTSGSGGGILNAGTLVVKNSILSENAASGYGGAINNFQDGTLSVYDSTISTNKAVNPNTNGGWGGGISNYVGTLTVMRSTISGNVSNDLGGGIHNRDGSLTITDTTLSYNSSRTGGGIYNFVDDALNINSSTLSKNSADQQGGAIYNAGFLTAINSTISQNIANEAGGIFVNSGSVTLESSTISHNEATFYGGIYVYSTLNFSNTIIANSVDSQDCGVWTDGTGVMGTNTNNLVMDGSCNASGINFLSGDPLLRPLADNGGFTHTHALLVDSPANNSGNCATAPIFDQRGEDRPIGLGCDRGAFEFNPAKDAFTLIFLPLIQR